MATTNLGRIALIPKGNWSAGTYKFLDIVRHQYLTNKPGAYICAAVTTTQEPGAGVDWYLAVEDGATGPVGTGDVTGPASSENGALAVFNGLTGKIIAESNLTGLIVLTSGVPAVAVSGTDVKTINGTSIIGSGNIVISPTVTWSVKTANYTLVAGDHVLADTSGGVFTLTLPATPTTGSAVRIADGGGAFATNNLTVARNGSTIMGLAEDMTVSTNNSSFSLVYSGTTWRIA